MLLNISVKDIISNKKKIKKPPKNLEVSKNIRIFASQ